MGSRGDDDDLLLLLEDKEVGEGEGLIESKAQSQCITPAVLDKALDLADWYAREVTPKAAENFKFVEQEMRLRGARKAGTVDKTEVERQSGCGAYCAFTDLMLQHVPQLLRLLFKRRWDKTYAKYPWRDGGKCGRLIYHSKVRLQGLQ